MLETLIQQPLLAALVALVGLSLVFGAVLGFASVRFRVEGNPLAQQIDALLPQTQCGQAAICTWMVYHWILTPLGLDYLRTISFILVIAAVVQFTKMFMEKTSPLLYRILGVFLPLITVNCAVLGVALLNINKGHTFWQATLYGLGGALGFALVLVLFSAMRERLAVADVPQPFKGAAIGMITAGLMSLAFMGFGGLV